MWVTHLSTLDDQFTDAAHEHVFSLTVFLVAAQREFKQRHYGQQLYMYNVVHVTRHLCFSGSTICIGKRQPTVRSRSTAELPVDPWTQTCECTT